MWCFENIGVLLRIHGVVDESLKVWFNLFYVLNCHYAGTCGPVMEAVHNFKYEVI